MIQNWNNIINFIKYNLGVPFNLLEISDDDIIEFLKNQVLPEYAQYEPHKLFVKLTSANITKTQLNRTYNEYEYTIDLPDDIYITGIENVMWNTSSTFAESSWSSILIDPTDIVLSNAYSAMRQSLQVIPEFNYMPPRTIVLSVNMGNGIIAEVNTIHDKLETISPDLYNNVFKQMCLSAVLKYLYNIRSKFSSVSTPFGDIQLNLQDLQNRASTIDADIQNKLNWIPPNQLVAWM